MTLYGTGFARQRTARLRTNERERTTLLRRRAIDKLGGKCTRCGFSDYRALQIDHVNGNGKDVGRDIRRNHVLYKLVLSDTTGKYQCLCANCNWIKRAERNENNQRKDEINEHCV